MKRTGEFPVNMTKEQKTLLGLLGKNLFGIPFEADPDVDWEKVWAEGRAQSVTTLSLHNWRELPISDNELSEKIEKAVMRDTGGNIHNRRCHAHLHKLMTEAGIKYCVLKGVASAHYYPSPLLRTMGDVDFYVDPVDVEKASEVLFADGFSTEDEVKEGHGHHLVFRKPKMHFEMHYEVAGIPNVPVGDVIKEYIRDLCEKADIASDEFVTYSNPSSFHHGLVMLLHLQHHMVIEGIGLRHICDWAVFVNSMKEGEFEELFREKLKNVGLWIFARIISLAAAMYLGFSEQAWMEEDSGDRALADRLMEEILAGGNFGRKIENRKYEGMMISVTGRDGKKKSRLRRSFESLNSNVRAHWSVVEKCPVLYPFGWIFVLLRLFFRILRGKRPSLHLGESIRNSEKRGMLYDRLRLYETEEDSSRR